jgi:hypothetical protein
MAGAAEATIELSDGEGTTMPTDQERIRLRFALDNLQKIRQRVGLLHVELRSGAGASICLLRRSKLLGQTMQILEGVLKLPNHTPPPSTAEVGPDGD